LLFELLSVLNRCRRSPADIHVLSRVDTHAAFSEYADQFVRAELAKSEDIARGCDEVMGDVFQFMIENRRSTVIGIEHS
jgi:hypothetical protein